MAQFLHFSGDDAGAWDLSLVVEKDMNDLIEQVQDIQIYHAVQNGEFLRDFAYRAYLKNETVVADRQLNESISRLAAIVDKYPDNKKALNALVLSYFYFWSNNDATLPDESVTAWLASVRDASNPVGCPDLDIAARQSVMAGELDQARIYVSRLIEHGYREPEFKKFCHEHGLCELVD